MSLAWIPKGILFRIQQICCWFLWKGSKDGHTFSWTWWDLIEVPKKWGGWGLKDLTRFSKELSAKLGWKNSYCRQPMDLIRKYISPLRPIEWIRRLTQNSLNISIMWCAIINSIEHIRNGLAWRIKSGSHVPIGMDPWSGSRNEHIWSLDLIQFLEQDGITTINDITDPTNTSIFSQG